MTTPGGTPPGWYPDPSNAAQQRYWDGSAWTENVAPLAPAAPSPQPQLQAQQQYVPAPPPKNNRGCIIALIVVGVLLVLGVAAFVGVVFVVGNEADDFLEEIESDLESDFSDIGPDSTFAP